MLGFLSAQWTVRCRSEAGEIGAVDHGSLAIHAQHGQSPMLLTRHVVGGSFHRLILISVVYDESIEMHTSGCRLTAPLGRTRGWPAAELRSPEAAI